MKVKKLLIVSDGKPGHFNQSIAFAKIKQADYDIVEVSFKSKLLKPLSYLLDQFNIYNLSFFNFKGFDFTQYDAIVSTGSSTYYFNKSLAKKYQKKSIVLMLPKSYKYSTFDYIIAQEHDMPPKLDNLISIPLNLSVSEPKGFVKKSSKNSLGIIIGGSNNVFEMEYQNIKTLLDDVFTNYQEYAKYITTSRRTPKEIEELIESYEFDYELIYSKEPSINPIPDFIDQCDKLFITIDSTSMISEARANSDAEISIIELTSKKENTKYHKLIEVVNHINSKIDFEKLLEKVKL